MSNNNREDEAQKWYKEVEANRARAIADAIEAGTIVEVAKWSEPDLYKQMIATRLSKEQDMLKAFAMLDEVLSRQRGKYIFYHDGRVGQNTTDTQTLKDLISIGVRNELSSTADRARVEYYLDRWGKQQPTPSKELPIPLEIDTPRARTAIERAIARGLMENAPEGLKWRGIGQTGTKAQLAYFCKCAWLPNNVETLPETALNKLFGVTRIGSAINKLFDAKKPQKWRAQIDELFAE